MENSKALKIGPITQTAFMGASQQEFTIHAPLPRSTALSHAQRPREIPRASLQDGRNYAGGILGSTSSKGIGI